MLFSDLPSECRRLMPYLWLLLAVEVHAGFTPIPLASSSYKYDVVVEASAPAPVVAGSYTTASMDKGKVNTGTSWYEEGYDTADPTTGLPHPGATFSSETLTNHQYSMAPSYTANDAVLLDAAVTSATLTFAVPAAYAQLSFLVSGGNNGATFRYTAHHANGSRDVGTNSIPDWFSGANPAWTANGRVDVNTFSFSAVNANNPRLYSLDVTLANAGSSVTSIDLTYISGSGHGAIMAISGATGTAFSPITVTGYNEDMVVEAAAGKPGGLTGVTTATMDSGTNNTDSTFYEMGYVPQAPASGLPPAGSLLTNVSAQDHVYLMPPSYSANNAVLIGSNLPAETLTPASPTNCAALSFLTTAGHGPAIVGCVVSHADGSSESSTFTVPDWYDMSPVALAANGRVYVNNATLDSLASGNPRLYAEDVTLNNTASPVTSIRLGFAGGEADATTVVLAVSGGSGGLSLTNDDFNANSAAATAVLQQWYSGGGLYNSTGWWNAANCLEAVIADIAANNDVQYLPVLTNTFSLNSSDNFLNEYYDDEGWWANMWIGAYDVTGNTNFLGMAKTIFADLTTGWDTTNTACDGGIWWNKYHNYKNAIPNELFLLAAIRLHQRTPGDAGTGSYFYWATNEWTWFKTSGMINSEELVNDGLNGCANNGQTTWTYNQGVILAGLTDLYKVTGNSIYLTQAEVIADAAIKRLVDANGVLVEPCESGDCGGDGPQFKGIFERYLAYLYDESRLPSYYKFLHTNAHAVWFKNRNTFNQLGLHWDGPFDTDDAARQSSAEMAVLALAEPVTAALSFAKGAGDPAFSHSIGGATGTLAWCATSTNATRADFLQYGPYISYLNAGPHAVHFRLAVNALGSAATNLAVLDVHENNRGTVLANAAVPWSDFVAANVPQDFTLLFTNLVAADPLEFRVYWNGVAGAPVFTISEVTIDGLQNWCAANLSHEVGRLDGLNSWEADPIRDGAAGYLARGPGLGGLPAGDYVAQFELKVDNFNRDNAEVAQISVVNTDDNLTVAVQSLLRGQFTDALYQEFPLNFTAAAGKHYDFRTFWVRSSNGPRLTERSVQLRPGASSFFAAAQRTGAGTVLSLVGVPGRTYTVQATPSLVNPQWSALGSVTVPAWLGSAQFMDSSSANNQFYRLSFP